MGKGKVVVGLGIVAIVVIGFVLWLQPLNDINSSLGVTILNDGEPVGDPLAWTVGDAEVDSFEATVEWWSTGSDLRWDTFDLDGQIKFFVVYDYGTPGEGQDLLDTYSWTSTNPSGSSSNIWYFANWLDTTQSSTWVIRVMGTLEAIVDDAYNQALEDNWTEDLIFTVEWSADLGTFAIGGSIT